MLPRAAPPAGYIVQDVEVLHAIAPPSQFGLPSSSVLPAQPNKTTKFSLLTRHAACRLDSSVLLGLDYMRCCLAIRGLLPA